MLAAGTDPDLSHIPYKRVIVAFGGVTEVTIVLCGYIDPAVKALEGKVITTQLLVY